MNREEFIEWFEKTVSYDSGNDSDRNIGYYRELVDYADFVFDEYNINDDTVEYCYEEYYWGGREYIKREFTFDEFKERYENSGKDGIK